MKIYLIWNHDEKYVFSFIEKIFLDGKAAGKYVREHDSEERHIQIVEAE